MFGFFFVPEQNPRTVGANCIALITEKIRESNQGTEVVLAMTVMEFVSFTQKNHRLEPATLVLP